MAYSQWLRLSRSPWADKICRQEVAQVSSDGKKKAAVRLPAVVRFAALTALAVNLAHGARSEIMPPSPPPNTQKMQWQGYRAVESLATSGRTQEALRQLDARLVHKPEDARAAYMKGLVLMQIGRVQEAERWFKMMQSVFPDLAQPYNALAVIYFGRGDLLSAQNVLQALLAEHPNQSIAQRNLADVYLQLARQSYEKILEANPKDAKISAIIHALDAIHDNSGTP